MSPLAAEVQRITAHTERIREVRMEMEAERMETKVVGEFEKLAAEWLADETFKGENRIEFLEGRVLSLARAVDHAYETGRKNLRSLVAIKVSDRGDCDSAIDPDEDNSGLEPAVEVCLTCKRPCSEICMWDSDECMMCHEDKPQRRHNGQIVGSDSVSPSDVSAISRAIEREDLRERFEQREETAE